MIYSKDFKRIRTQTYTKEISPLRYSRYKKQSNEAQKSNCNNTFLDGFEISGYLKSQLESVDSINSQIKSLNASIENTFNKY
jgi:hypothetical protein